LETLIEEFQEEHDAQFQQLKQTYEWEKQNGQWRKEGKLVIYPDEVKQYILKEHHNYPTAGHSGVASTYFSV